jgi:hypothetical protein
LWAAPVAHRHLVFLQVVIVDALLEVANHDLVGECVLLWKPGRRNGVQTREKGLVSAVLVLDRREGAFVQLVVVAIVSDGGGELGVALQLGLKLLFKERVLRSDSDSTEGGVEAKTCKGPRRTQTPRKRARVLALMPAKLSQLSMDTGSQPPDCTQQQRPRPTATPWPRMHFLGLSLATGAILLQQSELDVYRL